MNIIIVLLIICLILLIIILVSALVSFSNLKKDSEKTSETMPLIINSKIEERFREIIKENQSNTEKLSQSMYSSLKEIRDTNEKKLAEIQNNVNEKLDKSLNERLDSSFKTIGEQLHSLYKNLGELQSLSTGVDNLQKTLSNVKTRGIFGEVQLGNILSNTMDRSQYEIQYKIKNDEKKLVDYAIKIPDKDGKGGFVYLPIDSKFPSDMYVNVVNASQECDSEKLSHAIKDLSNAIDAQAKSIQSKYIDPPTTTAFAIMFLPTEALYAEVLRIPGLAEKCQNEYHVVIQGPTTITALINSFSIGFRYLTINKKTSQIEKTLQAVKSQYDLFSRDITTLESRINAVQKTAGDISSRNDRILSKLKEYDTLSIEDSNNELKIKELYIENDEGN